VRNLLKSFNSQNKVNPNSNIVRPGKQISDERQGFLKKYNEQIIINFQ